MPLISVILPVYNGEAYLRVAIESILNQTYTDFEFLIINDGSRDRTREIIQQFKDPRIRFLDFSENRGLVSRLNTGIDEATGKYIARMDADDISLPDRFQVQVDFLEKNPEIGLCGAWIQEIMGSEEKPQKKVYKYVANHDGICIKLLRHNSFAHPVVMMRRDVFIKHNIRYEHESFPSEDYQLWINLKNVTRFYNIPKILLYYRVHPKQTSTLELSNKKSTGIKLKLIREILGSVSEREEALYHDIIRQRYQHHSDYLLELYTLINRIIAENDKKKIYNTELLAREFESIWRSISRKCISENWRVILFWLKLYPTKFSVNYYLYFFYLVVWRAKFLR